MYQKKAVDLFFILIAMIAESTDLKNFSCLKLPPFFTQLTVQVREKGANFNHGKLYKSVKNFLY